MDFELYILEPHLRGSLFLNVSQGKCVSILPYITKQGGWLNSMARHNLTLIILHTLLHYKSNISIHYLFKVVLLNLVTHL